MAAFVSFFVPEPPQKRFLESTAVVRGYGGAVGGGKSRTMMEQVLDWCVDYPGIQVLVARLRHTSIIETTRKTFFRECLAGWPREAYRTKQSAGEDWLEFVNGSRVNFIGVEDTDKWMSSEIGCLVFDEAHEFVEDDVAKLMLRLRQKGMPHVTLVGFNPTNPGHWLQKWFCIGVVETDFGYYKEELFFSDADAPVGDCEFVFANAYANPYLPTGYIDRALKSLKPVLRERLLEGRWVLTDGSLFFDEQALTDYQTMVEKPWRQGITAGDVTGDKTDPVRVKIDTRGALSVFRAPVRETADGEAHRYIVAVDPSSGGAADYCGIQVVDIDAFEQAAEVQVKLDPDLAAVEAFRLAVLYNGAWIAVETTGGWGHTAVQAIEKLSAGWKGPRSAKPKLWVRRGYDRLAKTFTDILGWDTNTKTRMAMLDKLEQVLREREFGLYGRRTYEELTQFAWGKKGRPPAATEGNHDDLVVPLAIAVYIATELPRSVRRQIDRPHEALVGVTGY